MSQVGLIQMTSGPDPRLNLVVIEKQLARLAKQGVKLVLIPENALVFGSRSDYHQHAEPLGRGPVQAALANMAHRYQLWLVIGSMPIRIQAGVTTTTLVFDAAGLCVAHYDKLHMFDVDVDDQHACYRESDTFVPGNSIKLVDTPVGKLGLTICYDLRFPQLFSALRAQGAQIIAVPAAFTAVTGAAHWQVLLRARAIESQCWIIAAGQTGMHPCGRETWGHSMVIDPWGEIRQQLQADEGSLTQEVDHQLTESIRAKMPLASHARLQSQLKTT